MFYNFEIYSSVTPLFDAACLCPLIALLKAHIPRASCRHTHTCPSSPVEASMVPLMFHSTRHSCRIGPNK
jgi:hypothetical protein